MDEFVPYRMRFLVMSTVHQAGESIVGWSIDEMEQTAERPVPDYDAETSAGTETRKGRGANISVYVLEDGLSLTVDWEQLEPIEGCDPEGPTVCLVEEVDIFENVDQAREARRDGDLREAARLYDEILDAYDLRGLYNLAVEIARDAPDGQRIRLNAGENIPVGLLSRIAKAIEFELAEPYYEDRDSYWQARENGQVEGRLLPHVYFSIRQ